MSAFRLRKGWIRLLAAASGAVFLGGCVTDLQFRDFVTSTLIRTFWTSVSSYAQAIVVDRAQQRADQQSGN